MAYNKKGGIGFKLESLILKLRYGVNYNSGIHKFDLPSELNLLTNKNVSIKSSKTNSICCGDVFNFLESYSLEMVLVNYKKECLSGKILITRYVLIENLDAFFYILNKIIDWGILYSLKILVKGLKYPFSNVCKKKCHKMAKLVVKTPYCGFRVCCRLSSSNKRIQCVLNAPKFLAEVGYDQLNLKELE